MNERIKELVEQAMSTRKHAPPVWQFYDIELEKFAELIVLECIEVCKEQAIYDPAVLPYKPSEQFQKAIKEHFAIQCRARPHI